MSAGLAISAAVALALAALAQGGQKGSSSTLTARNGRWYPNFYGSRHGTYEEHERPVLGFQGEGFDWEMAASLSSINGWRNWYVEGATEQNPGFIQALREIVWAYPEAASFKIKFDGPWQTVSDVLDRATDALPQLLHGTSSTAWARIQRQGLAPRRQTGAAPAYGARLSNAAPADPGCVYLTTQLGTAAFAARDAAREHGGEPVILVVRTDDLDEAKLEADEDSESSSWRESVGRIGAVKYRGRIDPRHIRIYEDSDTHTR
jgi:hypothetical protein